MIVPLTVILLGSSCLQVNAYVLLQIQKGDNASKVDALIHKVVPNASPSRKSGAQDEKELGSIIFAIDDKQPNILEISKIDEPLEKNEELPTNGTRRDNRKSGTGQRSKQHSNMKIVHFRSGKPSLKLEVSASNVVQAINNLVANKDVRRYIDAFSHKFVNVYKHIQEELMKTDK